MKQSITRLAVIIQLMITVSLFFSACKKDENSSPVPVTPSGAALKTSVTGRITDTNGNIMIGVTVKLGSITTVSDNRGYFLFVDADVPKDRFVLVASKSGYFNCVSGKKMQEGDANYSNLMMEELPPVVNIQSSTGGIVNIQGGATITFPANAFVDQYGNVYNGQVNVYSRHFNPGEANFGAIIPGGDLLGLNTLGEEQSLYSLGMIEAKLYDNTGINELKLATGTTAALKFPIDPSQNAVAQSTIPMWHLDEATGIWQEEGQGTKTGNFYIANVSHFSTWNCDYSGERTDIKGLVVDCQNNPMSNVVVTINGFQDVTTDNFGIFTTWVPVGYLIECQVLQSNNPFLATSSPIQSVTAVAGQVNIIPTLVVACGTRISGSIMNCAGNTLNPGFIIITWPGGSIGQYTNTGNYDLIAPVNTNVVVTATHSGLTGNQAVQTGTIGNTVNVANINLCSTASIGNKFTITENGISTSYVINNITDEWAHFYDFNQDGIVEEVEILVEGTAIPGNIPCYIYIDILAYQNSMTCNLLYGSPIFDINLGSNFYTFLDYDSTMYTNNVLQFYDLGIIGTPSYGIFEFDCLDDTRVTNGEFNATREQY